MADRVRARAVIVSRGRHDDTTDAFTLCLTQVAKRSRIFAVSIDSDGPELRLSQPSGCRGATWPAGFSVGSRVREKRGPRLTKRYNATQGESAEKQLQGLEASEEDESPIRTDIEEALKHGRSIVDCGHGWTGSTTLYGPTFLFDARTAAGSRPR